MIKVLIVSMFLSLSAQAQNPTAYCTEGVSKPCGSVCISVSKNCRTPWTTAVIGIRPAKSKGKVYDKPEFVSKRPE